MTLNRTLTKKDRLNGNFSMQSTDRLNQQIFGFRDDNEGSGKNLAIGWSHTLGRRSTNILRWNLSRSRGNTIPFFAYKTDIAAELGIRGTSSNPVNYGPPNLTFTNFGALTGEFRCAEPDFLVERRTSVLKMHNFSVGGEFRRLQYNSLSIRMRESTFTFSGNAMSALDAKRPARRQYRI
jgi:hypothetical protein